MTIENMPFWMQYLEEEDVELIRRFVLASGSLKQLAKEYDVTYPTVRLRLDRLIQKINLQETQGEDNYIALVKTLALDDKLDFETAKLLIKTYQKQKEENRYV